MIRSMSRADITPVSYVVLGLVARDGPSTPYALKAAVGRGIAHFWQFPHSQIYAETEKDFFYKVVDAQLTFETDAEGKVVAVVLHQNGLNPRAVRAN